MIRAPTALAYLEDVLDDDVLDDDDDDDAALLTMHRVRARCDDDDVLDDVLDDDDDDDCGAPPRGAATCACARVAHIIARVRRVRCDALAPTVVNGGGEIFFQIASRGARRALRF